MEGALEALAHGRELWRVAKAAQKQQQAEASA
jgi:hypothetical protein